MQVAQTPETVPPSSSEQLVKGTTIPVYNIDLEILDTSMKTMSEPLFELIREREDQVTAASPSPARAADDGERRTVNPTHLAPSEVIRNLGEEETTHTVLPAILGPRPNEVHAASAVLVSTTQRSETQEASESSSRSSSNIFDVPATETIYFASIFTSNPHEEVAGTSKAPPHLEERKAEPTPVPSQSSLIFPASNDEEEITPISAVNANLGSEHRQAETTMSNIPDILGTDANEVASMSTPIPSVPAERKQPTTVDTPSELHLTSPNQAGSTADPLSAPNTVVSERDMVIWTRPLNSNLDNHGEVNESTEFQRLTEQRSEKTNSASLPQSSTLRQDKYTTAETRATHSTADGIVETTKSTQSDLLPGQKVEKLFTSAPSPEYPGGLFQSQDTTTTTTEAQHTADLRAEETASTKSDLTQQQAEEASMSAQMPESSASSHDKDISPTSRETQTTVRDSVGAATRAELNLRPEDQVRKKSPPAPEPESTSSWRDENFTPTTAAQSTIEERVQVTTSTQSAVQSEERANTFNSAQFSESSTSWNDRETTPTPEESKTTVQYGNELDTQSDQQENETSPSAPEAETSISWQDQGIIPSTPAMHSTLEDPVEATTSTAAGLESKQRAEKAFTFTRLPDSSTSWQGQGAPTSTETQTTLQYSVEAAKRDELDMQSDQQEEKKSPSVPGPKLSTLGQYEDVTPSTAPTHITGEDHVEATTSTISELRPEQQAEKTVSYEPSFESSTAWQDEDTAPRTATTRTPAEHNLEATTSSISDYLAEQRSEEALTSAQPGDYSTTHQVPDTTTSTTVAPLSGKDSVEATSTTEPSIEEPEGPKLVCYFTSWSIYRDDRGRFTPEDINPKLCTHILYAFSKLDSDTLEISMADPMADEDMELYQRVTALKAANRKLKVLLSLGGATDSDGSHQKYSRLTANATARRNFARHAASFVVEHRFDGLDVDWEYPNCESDVCPSNPPDKENFVLLLEDLRDAFDKYSPPLLLTAAISGDIETIEEAYLVPEMFKHLEFASIMAYDYYGAWSTVVGHYAPLQSAIDETNPEMSIEYVVQSLLAMGAPPSQLVLGVPFYAASFTLANPRLNDIGSPSKGAGNPGNVTHSPGVLSYYEICSAIKAGGWSTMMDPRAGVYAYSGDQWVCFDGPRSITRKARFAQRVGLAGLMVWDLSMDDFRGECGRVHPLLSAAHRALYPPSTTPAGSG